MTVPFVRQLGYQPGVQLNPRKDQTDGFSQGNQDQIFATAARFPRGRIDQPFVIDRSTVQRYLGIPDPIRASQLNEGYTQIYEALQRGSYQAVLYRLHTTAAALSYVVLDAGVVTVGQALFHQQAATAMAALQTVKVFADSAGPLEVLIGTISGANITVVDSFTVNAVPGLNTFQATTDFTPRNVPNGAVIGVYVAPGDAVPCQVVGNSQPHYRFTGDPGMSAHAYTTSTRAAYQFSAVTAHETIGPAAPAASDLWYVSANPPTQNFTLYFQHLECFNDGTQQDFHVDAVVDPVSNANVAANYGTLNVYDPITGTAILSATGSLDPNSVDDFGNSNYLPDIVQQVSVDLAGNPAFTVWAATGATIAPDSSAYGVDVTGAARVASSGEDALVSFSEGGMGYQGSDYDNAIQALKYTDLDYGNIISAGSRAPSLISRFAQLGYDTNRPVKIDVPGDLTPAAAVTWLQQLNLNTEYVSAFWAPLNADIATGGGKAVVGCGGIHVGFTCRRNAQRNNYGFAPKNFPIAGPDWAIDRTGIKQIYTPDEQELSLLAQNKIIPVIYDRFNAGGEYVFTDVLTLRQVQNSLLKLTSVVDMACEVDDTIARQSKQWINLPMKTYVARMNAFLDTYFGNAQSSDWLVPSTTLDNGAAFAYSVTKDPTKTADTVNTMYYCCYDGVVRQNNLTQTLVR